MTQVLNNARRLSDEEMDMAPAVQAGQGALDVATTRAAQEVQAMMVIAKRFPRDEGQAYSRIMQACKRRTLAEQSQYTYPRGDQTVSGPSIRMAEALAQSWGNLDYGIIELEQKDGESSVMAYCWDTETNTRQTKIFTVKHERHTRRGVTKLSDPRDIYEMAANQGARRLRACILGVIPGDVVDAAMKQCDDTIRDANKGKPKADRLRDMLAAFLEHGVSKEMVEKRLGHKVEITSEAELLQLKKIYLSIRDNMAEISSYFDTPATASEKTAGLNDQLTPSDQKPDDDAPAELPGDDLDHLSHPLVKQLANACNCTLDDAYAALDRHCSRVRNKPLEELDAKEQKDVERLIKAGDITV